MTRPGRREGVLARVVAAQTRTWHPLYRLRGGTVRTAARLAKDGAAMASLHVDVQDLLADPRSALEYGRVPLGFMDAKHSPLAPRAVVALAAPRGHHVLVMAQTGAGKTDAFTLPAVLSPSLAKTCMVVVDPTGALLNASMAYRAQCGRVSVYDPSNELGLPELSVHWSPLGALNRAVDVTDLEDRALAAALDLVGTQDDAGTTNSKFFALTATSLLRCLLLAAVWDQRQFTAVMGWVSAGASADKLDEVETILADYVDRAGGDREVLDAWGGFRALGADRLAERFATAAANLLAFSFASVKASADLSDPARAFDSRAFLRTPRHPLRRRQLQSLRADDGPVRGAPGRDHRGRHRRSQTAQTPARPRRGPSLPAGPLLTSRAPARSTTTGGPSSWSTRWPGPGSSPTPANTWTGRRTGPPEPRAREPYIYAVIAT